MGIGNGRLTTAIVATIAAIIACISAARRQTNRAYAKRCNSQHCNQSFLNFHFAISP
jgi:hypothetical protein